MGRSKPGKLRIERALLELLVRKPLAQVSVTELCDAAHASRSTFYANYANVDELYRSLVGELLRNASSLGARLRCDGDSSSTVSGAFQAKPLCAIVRDPGEFAGLVGDERFLQAVIETCQSSFPEGSLGIYLNSVADPKTAEALFLFQMTGCISAAKAFGESEGWPSIQRALDAFIRGGLAAVKGMPGSPTRQL